MEPEGKAKPLFFGGKHSSYANQGDRCVTFKTSLTTVPLIALPLRSTSTPAATRTCGEFHAP